MEASVLIYGDYDLDGAMFIKSTESAIKKMGMTHVDVFTTLTKIPKITAISFKATSIKYSDKRTKNKIINLYIHNL